ncbi:MAG: WG repeat-containing protein, partial [Saprospiraceae bacterium]|nr:WG repeat-containing protein [Saprospiraceae bacterium]
MKKITCWPKTCKAAAGLLYRDGNEALPFLFEDIRAAAGLWIAENEEGYQFYTRKGQPWQEQSYEAFSASEQYIALKKSGKWALFDTKGLLLQDFKYDSISFLRDLLVLHQGRNTFVEFPNQKRISLPNIKALQVVRSPAENKPYFLLVEQQNSKKGLYNTQGVVVLPTRYDRIYLLDKQLISVGIGQKNGLMDTLGRELVKMEYEGIGNVSEGFVPLLKGGKFGLFDPLSKVLFPPVYDLLPRAYARVGGQVILTVRKEGHLGI